MRMSKLLVTGLWMLLGLSVGNAIWCNKCRRLVFDTDCQHEDEYCWVDHGGGCYTEKVYSGKKLISYIVGCETPCVDSMEPRPRTKLIEYYCCFEDYCPLEAMAHERSTITEESSRSEKPVCLIWGCKLDGENPTYTFEMPEAWSSEEQLTLRTICLGENAKDEFNIVEVVPPKGSRDSSPVRIATLKLSVLPMVTLAGFELTPPVTFRLKSGLGPVYLAGQHVAVDVHWNETEEEDLSSEEEEEMEDSPVKPAKRPFARQVAKKQEQFVQEPSLGKEPSRGNKPATRGELRL